MSGSNRRERVYLTGFMGSGKSTIGPIVANTIGFEFIDTDKEIERREKKTISRIFQEDGEVFFRDRERALIQELSVQANIVISLGGGTIADPQNFPTISTSGITVYLRTSLEQLLRRLQHKTNRPTLHDEMGNVLPPDLLTMRIAKMFEDRSPFYEKADIIVPTDGTRVGVTVDEIVRQLTPFLKP